MELIKLTHDNLEQEHICCAIAKNNDIQVSSKKAWLAERLDDGLVFLKGDVRGKCFIEYIPAEEAWAPIKADGYMYIDCLWVSGQFKGHGYSSQLLETCIRDSKAQGKKGLCLISSKKKMGFLADSKYLTYKGFSCCDSQEPYFELWYLPFEAAAEKPSFLENAVVAGDGFVLYYTHQCPFTAKYVPLLEKIAVAHGVNMHTVRITGTEEAKKCPCPFTTFSLFYNGKFITHEIQSEKKFEKLITEIQAGDGVKGEV